MWNAARAAINMDKTARPLTASSRVRLGTRWEIRMDRCTSCVRDPARTSSGRRYRLRRCGFQMGIARDRESFLVGPLVLLQHGPDAPPNRLLHAEPAVLAPPFSSFLLLSPPFSSFRTSSLLAALRRNRMAGRRSASTTSKVTPTCQRARRIGPEAPEDKRCDSSPRRAHTSSCSVAGARAPCAPM